MRVAFLPVYPNPYQRLLAEALARHDMAVEMLPGLPSAAWLRAQRPAVDVLHFHWLYGLYMANWRTPAQAVAFLRRFRLARALGYGIVWTAHNVLPHRAAGLRPLHVAIRRLMMAEADGVIVHCPAGQEQLAARFPRSGPLAVIPHGHYRGLYPTPDRAAARQRLGLPPDSFVYLSLGNIAAYKGLAGYAAVFRATAAADDVAVIAGRDRDARLVRRLRQAAAADARLRLDVGFVPDARMGDYLAAADVLVAPFTHILTSGSVIAALSYGLPVIAPDLGCLRQTIAGAGLVYPAGRPNGLAAALAAIKSADRAQLRAAAVAAADGLGWDDIARQTAAVYRAVAARTP